MFRGIADERARVAFSGQIHIAPARPAREARQSLRGLIEGAGAEIDLRPQLEINTDDVRAATARPPASWTRTCCSTCWRAASIADRARAAQVGIPERRAARDRAAGLRAAGRALAAGQLQDVPWRSERLA